MNGEVAEMTGATTSRGKPTESARMRQLGRTIARLCSVPLGWLACQPTPRPPPAPGIEAELPSSEPVAAATRSSDAGADSAASSPDAGQPVALPAVSDSRSVGCVTTKCPAPSETCCVFSDRGACVATVPKGPHDDVQLLASQLEACGAKQTEYSLTEVRRCDESSDCPGGESCCGMFLFGGASANVCVKQNGKRSAPCDFSEVCIDSSTCQVSGSECIDGVCAKRVERLACGKQKCSGETSACCGDPPSCMKPSECEFGMPRYRCASPKDCLHGQHCQVQVMGSLCTNFVDIANTTMACDTQADCGSGEPFCKRHVCRPAGVGSLKTCICP